MFELVAVIRAFVIYQAKMPNTDIFLPLKCEDLLLFSQFYATVNRMSSAFAPLVSFLTQVEKIQLKATLFSQHNNKNSSEEFSSQVSFTLIYRAG